MVFKVAVMSVSTRPKPYNKFISQYVETRKPDSYDGLVIEHIDLAEENLPAYNELISPKKMPRENPTSHYLHEHTRNWSAKVLQYDAFIIVTPQYNWSIPASLKNAIDYLCNEWRGKPVGLVTYGTRGGFRAANHLVEVLGGGLKMEVCESKVQLKITDESYEETQKLGRLSADRESAWKADGSEKAIEAMYSELLRKLEANQENQKFR
jgi:NAD(P)H-dependent FMN reductase